MYFFALSQAPPELAIEMASMTPVTSAPANSPPSAGVPRRYPTMMGEVMARIPGATISFRAAEVEISIHLALSPLAVPSMSPSIFLN